MPPMVTAGEEFSMQFSCMYPDKSLCPAYYMVLFHGPTRQSVLPDAFGNLTWTANPPDQYTVVSANWTIHDPGVYRVYAYPQLNTGPQWQGMSEPWYKAGVQGSPFNVVVTPNHNANSLRISEDSGGCTSDDIDDGRYLSINASSELTATYNGTGRSYIYVPYQCKIPHRTILDVVKAIPSSKHFVFLGDSTMRGPFCVKIWKGLHGTVRDSVCDYMTDPEQYLPARWTDKTTTVEVPDYTRDFPETRNVSATFVWSPDPDTFKQKKDIILAMNPPPTHVVMNMGAYVNPRCILTIDGLVARQQGVCGIFTRNFSAS
jgi:hypothetical protein